MVIKLALNICCKFHPWLTFVFMYSFMLRKLHPVTTIIMFNCQIFIFYFELIDCF